jgi:hypothetical protein
VLFAEVLPVTSRHLPDCGFTKVLPDFVHTCEAVPLQS